MRMNVIMACVLGVSLSNVALAYGDCSLPKNSGKAVNVRAFGALGDGKTDDTKAFEDAIAHLGKSGGLVDVPAGIYMIDATRSINLKDNINLTLARDTHLKAIPNKSSSFSILTVKNAINVGISGGNLVGERDQHMGNAGEWGMGLTIRNSTDVVVKNIISRDNWGDGFYVGDASANIEFCSVEASRNRRQGMSITSGKNIRIEKSVFKNTFGAKPQAGLDIEPNENQSVQRVHIQDSEFSGNFGAGLVSYVAPKNKNTQATEILIENNTFRNNKSGGGIIFNSYGVRFVNNVFENNKGSALNFDPNTANGLIDNNIIYGSAKDTHNIINRGQNSVGQNIYKAQ